MPKWAKYALSAAGGGLVVLGAGYVWVVWYLTREPAE